MATITLSHIAATSPPQPPRRGVAVRWLGALALWMVVTLGIVLIAISYSISSQNGLDQTHYQIFWAGALLFYVPTVIAVTARHVSDRVRVAWLLVYGLATYIPKLLRDPSAPLFHDEVAHWRQTIDLAGTGHLFSPNFLIGIISQFPGLHIVTATLSETTGVPEWQCALVLMAIAHLAALYGAALLGSAVLGTTRAGAVVALVYSLNSSFMYFDTQFAYESLAMPMFIACLACLAKAHQAAGNREELTSDAGELPRHRQRGPVLGWTGAASIAGIATVSIHHLTALILCLLLACIAVITAIAALRRRTRWWVAGSSMMVAAAVSGAAACWFAFVAPSTAAYLSPYLGTSLDQLLNVFHHDSGPGSGTRTPFQASTEPLYERVSAFTVPVLMGLLFLVAAARWVRLPAQRRFAEPLRLALGLFGLMYFLSVPFILVEFGAEGARRTWGFTYIGLAVTVAPLIIAIRDRFSSRQGYPRLAGTAVSLVLACDVFVGNVAAGLSEFYRFPGPFLYGSDARSFTSELDALSQWVRQNLGTGVQVVSDRYTNLGLVRGADAHPAAPSTGFATYDLWFDPGPPSTYLLDELSDSGYYYFIVDKRMASLLPQVGVFFEPDEPVTYDTGKPIDSQNLSRYQNMPWTVAVYESDSYVVYRFDFAAYGRQVYGGTR